MIIYCHAVRGKVRFSTLFSRGTRLTEAEIGLLLRFEHHNCFSFDAETDFCPVGLGAGRFLSLSYHVNKRFLAVVRLVGEQSSIADEAAQLFKILNIKQQAGALRLICLNYLGQVGVSWKILLWQTPLLLQSINPLSVYMVSGQIV